MRSRTLILVSALAVAIAACGDRGAPVDQLRTDGPARATNGFEEGKVAADASLANYAASPSARAEGPGTKTPTDTASLPTMLIRTGSAEVRVDSLEPAIAALEALARRSGGYIGNTSFMGGEERRRAATLQLRVPSGRFGDVQAGLAAIGEVRSLNVQVQDVGEEYTDASARVRSKRQVEARLIDLLRTRVG
ncbi:MAG: DUF4349 domain-containing protein, partial [Gemmatimonadales bacterium]